MEVLAPIPPRSSPDSLHNQYTQRPNPSRSGSQPERGPSRHVPTSPTRVYALHKEERSMTMRTDSTHPPSSIMPRTSRRHSVPTRQFSPLTPIVASPLSTPTPSISSNVEDDERDLSPKLGSDATNFNFARIASSITSTTHFGNSVTPTWTTTPPTPPPKSFFHSVPEAPRPSYNRVPLSASFPASLSSHESLKPVNFSKRRASLPPMASSKPLPPTPPPPPPDAYKASRLHGRQGVAMQASPLRTAVVASSGDISPCLGAGDSSKESTVSRHLFHIPQDTSDKEDDCRFTTEDGGDSANKQNATTSTEERAEHRANDYPPKESHLEKFKDDTRKHYALMELLTTEIGYLMDLRTLVTVYIRHLPMLLLLPAVPSSHFNSSSNLSLSPFSRTSPTSLFLPSPSHSIYQLTPQYQPHPPTSFVTSSQNGNAKERDKHTPRHLFTHTEVDLVTRNIEDILTFHEVFVKKLRESMRPLGYSSALDEPGPTEDEKQGREGIGTDLGMLEEAIEVVSNHFTAEASGFSIYESFCSGHPEAFDIIHKAQQEHSAEWQLFERWASSLVSAVSQSAAPTSAPPLASSSEDEDHANEHPAQSGTVDARTKRRHSLSSLDIPTRPILQSVKSISNLNFPSDQGHTSGNAINLGRRLAFMDYLIKPVQRICKYPLLLDQLKVGNTSKRNASIIGLRRSSSKNSISHMTEPGGVEIALRTMRLVASQVDEARRRQDILVKSSLIVSRVCRSSPQPSGHSTPHNLTGVFLSSLGACLLSGSLDVVYRPPSENASFAKAKYMGAFLYMGGYLLLVKVLKGKVYEPRHWFSLTAFELVDPQGEDAVMSCSFRLSCKGHWFDLSAACQREKDVWMSAIHESLTLSPSWNNEPASSLHEVGSSCAEEGPFDGLPSLPTIRSIPETEFHEEKKKGQDMVVGDEVKSRTLPRLDINSQHESIYVPPSRRSSTASVKAIFYPTSSNAMLLRRPSPPSRLQVDRGLQDVISELCLSARSHANSHDEGLFRAPEISYSGFVKSNSGLSMAGAMGVAAKNRLTKHESMLVPRRKSIVDGCGSSVLPETSRGEGPKKNVPRTKSWASRKYPKKASGAAMVPVVTTSSVEENDGAKLSIVTHNVNGYPDSPTPLSQCSSMTASGPNSPAPSPVVESILLPVAVLTRKGTDLLVVDGDGYRPKRTRSMVDNVRGFFYNRSSSPTPSTSRRPLESFNAGVDRHATVPSLSPLKWWSKDSLRRRVRSAPEVPGDDVPSLTGGLISLDSSIPSPNQVSVTTSPEMISVASSPLAEEFGEDTSRSSEIISESPVTVSRRRSIFSYSNLRPMSKASDGTKPEVRPRRLSRNISLLHRFSSFTSSNKDPS